MRSCDPHCDGEEQQQWSGEERETCETFSPILFVMIEYGSTNQDVGHAFGRYCGGIVETI